MHQEQDEHYESVDLHIRWNEGQDLVIRASPLDSIADIKQKIRHSAPQAQDKHIRLIRNGRVLDDARRLCGYGIGQLVRDTNSKAKVPPPPPVYIHCSVSDYIPPTPQPRPQQSSSSSTSTATTSPNNNEPQMSPPTGFDRLRESGFSEEDIQGIRARFHRMHGTGGDDNSEEARNLEEQWIDNTTETLADGTVQGTYKEMMWGLILGFFVGIICLFWFRESVFTRRHQMGIVAGILINISFGVLHVYY
ncbi:DUF2407 C-terminal domain-containing protein [Zychaea mexicana]|uniref:DUF2407 C-terminal domain-containing protein n=1 Tax=Zychaea mexicana TaxID=64656 RepID=UPI0022FEEECB|nr:DUF2407 C-terminal domain-containing protein [Zychaea mexicana]KAI9491345.1 DUF2407 C-terminal domain-containing protein [Zychaea mexicana]